MPLHYKKYNFVCYSEEELIKLFSIKKIEIIKEMLKRNITFDDIKKGKTKIEEIINSIVGKLIKNNSELEIFIALFSLLDFYKEKSEICFKMKNNFNYQKHNINILKNLKKYREENTDNDFSIKTKDKFYVFQLKFYKKELQTKSIFNFIKEKIKHYGNNLGDTNLLIILQAKAWSKSNINFKKLYENIKNLNYNFKGKILITYNEENTRNIIIEIYPNLNGKAIPWEWPSEKIKKFSN